MEYKDRSTGLVVFGILTVGLGFLCGLLAVLLISVTLFAGSMPSNGAAPKPSLAMMVPAVTVYGVMAVALIWLGVGSTLAKRWARALLLIFSWSWLIVGLIAITAAAFVLPGVLAHASTTRPSTGTPPSSAVMNGVLATIFLFYGVIFVALPALWTFFYNSRHVKATCEARHPEPSWTDACPLPVLAVVTWLVYSVLNTLIMPLNGMGALPFFGTFLTGVPADAAFVLLSAIYLFAAWRIYHLDLLGWWLLVGVFGFFMISGVLTFAQHDLIDMYRAMNFPADQMAQMEKTSMMKGKGVLWIALLASLPLFGYLVYIRRFFRRPVMA